MVVDPVPTAHHRVHLMVAPTKSVTQLKRVTAKGKAVSHLVTQLWVHKTTWAASASPGVDEVTALIPPITKSGNVPSIIRGACHVRRGGSGGSGIGGPCPFRYVAQSVVLVS